MKFTVTGDLRKNKALRDFLLFFQAMTFVFLLLNIPMEKQRWGLTKAEISDNILGNQELFRAPKDFAILLTDLHVELFIYLFIAAMGLLVLLRRPIEDLQKRWQVALSFFVVFINGVAPLLIFWGMSGWVTIKWISFWALTLLLLSQALSNFFFLLAREKS